MNDDSDDFSDTMDEMIAAMMTLIVKGKGHNKGGNGTVRARAGARLTHLS